jgi:Mrp family chromosome partitioning ATPase
VKQGTVEPIILIDLPPVLLTDDALVVAPKVDAVLVVASEGLTSQSGFTKALDLLSEFRIAGVVLNRTIETVPNYNYGYDLDDPKGITGKGA